MRRAVGDVSNRDGAEGGPGLLAGTSYVILDLKQGQGENVGYGTHAPRG